MRRPPMFAVLSLVFSVAGIPPAFAQSADDLAESVKIRRTEYGVPHILADTERGAGFGMGYVQAEDHCATIMKLIITARGELAKTFGDVNGNLESDFWYRQYRVHQRARETFDGLDADWRAMLEGYAMGFNYYVDQRRTELPEWVDHITAQDVAAHGLAGVARFAFNRGRIVDQFIAKIEMGADAVVDAEDMGSNMWAFDGTRTTTGNAILMGNPHQPWSEVATYYEAHLTVPGKYNFYGSTFIGRPVMTTGFNAHLGWTHTVNYPDLEEIYAFDIDPDNPDRYMVGDERLEIETREVSVEALRGSMLHEVTRSFQYTPDGPVVHRDEDRIYVLRSAAYNEYRFYQQWYRLGQAKNFPEFRRALEIMAIPMFNLGYADDEGNIYYLWNGTVPRLPHAAHGATAVYARNRGNVWSDFVPFEGLPQLYNPHGGYVMNSNSAPYFTNLHVPMDRSDYPAYFPDNRLSLRSQHSLSLIHNEQKFGLEDVVDMKFSMKALLVDRVLDDLLEILRSTIEGADSKDEDAKPKKKKKKRSGSGFRIGFGGGDDDDDVGDAVRALRTIRSATKDDEEDEGTALATGRAGSSSNPELEEAIEFMEDWDRTVSADSEGSALFQEWWTAYTGENSIYTDQEAIFAEVWDESRPMETPRGIADPDRAVEAFAFAMRDMKNRFDSWDVRWGDIHRMRTGDKDLPLGGGGHDIGGFRIVLYEEGDDGKYMANSGDSWVFAVEFGDTPQAYTLVAYSQSGDPDSPHFNDQAELYADHRMKPAAFTEADIQEQLLVEYTPASR